MQLRAQLPVAVGNFWQPLPYEYVRGTLEELCNLSGQLELNFGDYGTIQPTVRVLETQEKHSLKFGDGKSIVFERPEWWEVLEVEAYLNVGAPLVEEVGSLNPDLSGDDALSLLVLSLGTIFEEKLYDLALVANLARPGSVELFEGHVLIEDHKIHATKRFSSWNLREATRLAEKLGWPKLDDLSVSEVWQWSEPVEGLSAGYSTSPVGRALNALSHLTSPGSSQPFSLFWALMGLEALYIRGSGGVMEQLREKIHTLLGTPVTHKKRFTRMYDLRSRIIHGQLDFSSAYSEIEGPEDDRFHKDLGEATDLATALLLATLQQLVKRDWWGLRFSYVVDDSP